MTWSMGGWEGWDDNVFGMRVIGLGFCVSHDIMWMEDSSGSSRSMRLRLAGGGGAICEGKGLVVTLGGGSRTMTLFLNKSSTALRRVKQSSVRCPADWW